MIWRSRAFFVALVLGALLLVLAIWGPSFYQGQPLLSLATSEAPTLITVCGMTLVFVARQVDISIGSQFGICGVAAGILAVAGLPAAAVAVAAVLIGALLGAVNGLLVAGLQLPSIVVTLATMVTWRQGLQLVRQGEFVNLPDGLQWFGLSQAAGQWSVIAAAAAILVALGWAMRNVAAGRLVYAVGTNSEAARLAGLRPRWVIFLTFVLMGALTGAAAMLNVIQSPQVDPKMGTGLELKAIAAVVVGGVAISGGRGTVWGALLGFFLLACVAPALIHLHVDAYWEKAIQGAIILVAVAADSLQERRQAA